MIGMKEVTVFYTFLREKINSMHEGIVLYHGEFSIGVQSQVGVLGCKHIA